MVLLSLLGAFSRTDAGPDLTAEHPFMSRAEIRQQGAVTVRAAVLTDDESERYFGASLADQGIQAVWLSVDNAGDLLLRFRTPTSLMVAGQRQCLDCSGSGTSPAAECDPAKGRRCRVCLYAP